MKVKLGELTKIKTGKLDANASSPNGTYPFFTCSVEPLRIDTYSYDCECVLVAGNGDLNVKYYKGKFDAYQRTYIIEENGKGRLYMPYLYYFMIGYMEELRKMSIGGVIKYIKLGNLTEALIELPDIDKQHRIVHTLQTAERILSARRRQLALLDNLIKARFVEMFGDPVTNPMGWEKVALYKVCKKILGGGTPSKAHPEYYEGNIPWVTPKDMKYDIIVDTLDHITENAVNSSSTKIIPPDSVLMVIRSGILKHTLPVSINQVPVTINQDMKAFIPNGTITAVFLREYFHGIETDVLSGIRGVTADNIDFKAFQLREIILPPLQMQKEYSAFVARIDKTRTAVEMALDEAQVLFDSLMQRCF